MVHPSSTLIEISAHPAVTKARVIEREPDGTLIVGVDGDYSVLSTDQFVIEPDGTVAVDWADQPTFPTFAALIAANQ